MITALKLSIINTSISLLIGIPVGFVYSPEFYFPLLWAVAYFGACVIPPSTGVVYKNWNIIYLFIF